MSLVDANLGRVYCVSTRATKAKGEGTSEAMLYDASNIVTTEIAAGDATGTA